MPNPRLGLVLHGNEQPSDNCYTCAQHMFCMEPADIATNSVQHTSHITMLSCIPYDLVITGHRLDVSWPGG